MEVKEKKDYDQSIKINGREIKCYSRKKMKDLYPSGNYSAVGETFENNKKKNKNNDIIILAGKKMIVSEPDKHSKILYKKKGYISVGENQFLVILQNRLIFLLLLLGIIILGIIIGIWICNALKRSPVVAPEYPLPPEADKAKDIINDNSKNTDSKHKNHASIKVAREVNINLNSREVSFIYQNFNASNKAAVVTLCILKDSNEYAIARSGLVKAGKEIDSMNLLEDAVKLSQGVYKGRIKIDFYDEVTGEKAATSTDFDDVEVKVK